MFVVIVLLQSALFIQHAKTDVIWAYPTSFDQTAYLAEAYTAFDQMTKEGVSVAIEKVLERPTPTGKLFPLEAAILFLFTGPGRLGALTLNLVYLVLLEWALFSTVLWLTGRWNTAFTALGLLLATASRFYSAGGLMDFRIDFAACCLFGIFICVVVRSAVFQSPRWSVAAGAVAGMLIDTRFLTALYVSVILLALFLFFLVSKSKQAIHLFYAGSVLLIITFPLIWVSRAALIQYYLVASVGESSIRNAEFGVSGMLSYAMFYPASLLSTHLGGTYLILAFIVFALAAPTRLWEDDSPLMRAANRRAIVFFVPCTLLIPLVVLTVFPSKSPVVASILILPAVANTLLIAFTLAGRFPRRFPRRWSGLFPALLAVLAVSVGFGRELEGAAQRVLPPGSIADYTGVSALYDAMGSRIEKYGWSEPQIVFDRVYDFLFPTILQPFFYERHGLILNPQSHVGTSVMPVPEKVVFDAIDNADIVVLTDPQSLPEPGIQYQYNVVMHDEYKKLKDLAEHGLLGVGRFHLFSQDVTLYVRPTLSLQGDSGGWITSDGVILSGLTEDLRLRPVVELSGTTILSENLGSTLQVRVSLLDEDQTREESVTTIKPSPQYRIMFRVNPDTLTGSLTRLRLSFDKFFVPKEIGLNPDTRKLVLLKPDKIRLLPGERSPN